MATPNDILRKMKGYQFEIYLLSQLYNKMFENENIKKAVLYLDELAQNNTIGLPNKISYYMFRSDTLLREIGRKYKVQYTNHNNYSIPTDSSYEELFKQELHKAYDYIYKVEIELMKIDSTCNFLFNAQKDDNHYLYEKTNNVFAKKSDIDKLYKLIESKLEALNRIKEEIGQSKNWTYGILSQRIEDSITNLETISEKINSIVALQQGAKDKDGLKKISSDVIDIIAKCNSIIRVYNNIEYNYVFNTNIGNEPFDFCFSSELINKDKVSKNEIINSNKILIDDAHQYNVLVSETKRANIINSLMDLQNRLKNRVVSNDLNIQDIENKVEKFINININDELDDILSMLDDVLVFCCSYGIGINNKKIQTLIKERFKGDSSILTDNTEIESLLNITSNQIIDNEAQIIDVVKELCCELEISYYDENVRNIGYIENQISEKLTAIFNGNLLSEDMMNSLSKYEDLLKACVKIGWIKTSEYCDNFSRIKIMKLCNRDVKLKNVKNSYSVFHNLYRRSIKISRVDSIEDYKQTKQKLNDFKELIELKIKYDGYNQQFVDFMKEILKDIGTLKDNYKYFEDVSNKQITSKRKGNIDLFDETDNKSENNKISKSKKLVLFDNIEKNVIDSKNEVVADNISLYQLRIMYDFLMKQNQLPESKTNKFTEFILPNGPVRIIGGKDRKDQIIKYPNLIAKDREGNAYYISFHKGDGFFELIRKTRWRKVNYDVKFNRIKNEIKNRDRVDLSLPDDRHNNKGKLEGNEGAGALIFKNKNELNDFIKNVRKKYYNDLSKLDAKSQNDLMEKKQNFEKKLISSNEDWIRTLRDEIGADGRKVIEGANKLDMQLLEYVRYNQNEKVREYEGIGNTEKRRIQLENKQKVIKSNRINIATAKQVNKTGCLG